MSVESVNTLKSWFVTFARPIQQQFWSWIDSFRHKSDPIQWGDLSQEVKDLIMAPPAGIIQALVLSAGTDIYQFATGVFVEKVLFIDATGAIDVSVGTASGSDNIYGTTTITNWGVLAGDYYVPNNTTIFFNGITPQTII